jgi:hypothetical protein
LNEGQRANLHGVRGEALPLPLTVDGARLCEQEPLEAAEAEAEQEVVAEEAVEAAEVAAEAAAEVEEAGAEEASAVDAQVRTDTAAENGV